MLVIFARWSPLEIPRCNCIQRVFHRNCCNSRESIRPGIKTCNCNCNCNLQNINSPTQRDWCNNFDDEGILRNGSGASLFHAFWHHYIANLKRVIPLTAIAQNLGADFWEVDLDSNFSIFGVRRFTEWPGPHSLNCLSCRNPYQTPHSLIPPPFSLKTPFFSLKSASSDPLPKNRLLKLLEILEGTYFLWLYSCFKGREL